ncbi:type I secretion system permease/ATPase [Salmonella enterica]|nr:type I secretion system permease/ATPase [Salmonella enterica]ECF8134862.1 type I secretion system permease/ATPase [Salmonella enterica]EGI1955491.1 type I secretion system permease/ATPase [Salmonella enterica]EMA3598515.1 type I secretion system permease/ATPase [Salmonella enterica]
MDNKTYLENIMESIVIIANNYRLDFSPENINITARWAQAEHHTSETIIKTMAKQAGLMTKFISPDKFKFSHWSFPVVLELTDRRVCVAESLNKQGEVTVIFSDAHGMTTQMTCDEICSVLNKVIIFTPIANAPDIRADAYIRPVKKHWMWRILLRDTTPYKHVMIASFFINVLGLAGITFSMQTYDRIIPAQSYPTLFVLVTAVLIAFVFDFILKTLRYSVIDFLGKKADMRISDRVYGHALRIKDSHRPHSTGTFITQLRDLEQIREMMTSGTVALIADLPFFFFFLFIIYLLGGPLAVVPLSGLFLMIIPGLLCQKKLYALANEAMRESTLRSGMLLESVQGLQDIKALQAEYRFQQQWIHYTRTSAESNLRLKHLTHKLQNWSYLVQNSVFVGVICMGIPAAMSGELSTGALVASSILSSRMMGPVSQIAGLINRWQQTKVSIKGIDNIMSLPVDSPDNDRKVYKNHIRGHFKIIKAGLRHHVSDAMDALYIDSLEIRPGEAIAILGRNGAGKSSLLNALYNRMDYSRGGSISVDGIEINHLDPADLRRDVGLLSQNARLFYGTIRENILAGNPLANEEEINNVIARTGVANFIDKLPKGMHYLVQEGGAGLSAGQKQSILLSRLLLRNPTVLLLDEPTASFDELTEREFIKNIKAILPGITLIISTHRQAVLELVERIIVVADGKVKVDTKKDEALKMMGL